MRLVALPRTHAVLFVILLIAPVVQAQVYPDDKVAVPREPAAIALLDKVVEAMGGHQALAGAHNSTHTASVVSTSSGSTSNDTATWTNSDISHSFHLGDGDQFPHIQHNETSNGQLTQNGQTHQLSAAVAEAYFDPFDIALLLSRSLANVNRGLVDGGSVTKDGRVVDKVTITSTIEHRAVRKTLLVDATTYLPVELDFCMPALSPSTVCHPLTYRFGAFRRESGILYPEQVTLSDLSGPLHTYSLLSGSPAQ